ncbi:MAG: MFS transporter [Pseudomonadota bacterium]
MKISEESKNKINFYLAYTLSAFGYEFILFVMTINVYKLTERPMSVGIFMALSLIPKLLSPYFGSLSDRYRREMVFGLAAGFTGLLVITINMFEDIRWIYVLWFFVSILAVIIVNARTAIMTEVTTKGDYVGMNSIVLMALNFARIFAPLLGGIIVGIWSAKFILYFTGAVHFLVMIFSLLIRFAAKDTKRASAHIKEGFQFIIGNSQLSYLLTLAVCWRLFLGYQLSLFVVYVETTLGQQDTQYGIFMSMVATGSIIGSFLGSKISKIMDHRRLIHWGIGAHYLSFVLLGLIDNYTAALVTVFLSFMIFYATIVGVHSQRDKEIRTDLRGRIAGSTIAATSIAAVISVLVGSYFAGIFGVGKVLISGGILGAVSLMITGLAFPKSAALQER